MDSQLFFHGPKGVAKTVFGGHMTADQVSGCERIIAAADQYGYGVEEAKDYWLATSFHETGARMQPVREAYGSSAADTIKRLDKAFKAGQLTWVKTPYWHEGWFGRGDVQLTHEANYSGPLRDAVLAEFPGCDIHADPDLALRPDISAFIMIEGTSKGHTNRSDFTKYTLETFISAEKTDFTNARKTVNPGEKDSYAPIAKIAQAFRAARRAASPGVTATVTTAPKPQPMLGIVGGPSILASLVHAAAPAIAAAVPNVYGPELYDGTVQPIVERVQTLLTQQGYPEVGKPDGRWGTKTRGIVLMFRADRGLPLTPTIDDQLMSELARPGERPGLDDRRVAKASSPELKDKPVIKEALSGIQGAKIIAGIGTIFAGGTGINEISDQLTALKSAADQAQAIYTVVKGVLPYMMVAAVAFGAWYFLHTIIQKQVENYRTSRLS